MFFGQKVSVLNSLWPMFRTSYWYLNVYVLWLNTILNIFLPILSLVVLNIIILRQISWLKEAKIKVLTFLQKDWAAHEQPGGSILHQLQHVSLYKHIEEREEYSQAGGSVVPNQCLHSGADGQLSHRKDCPHYLGDCADPHYGDRGGWHGLGREY